MAPKRGPAATPGSPGKKKAKVDPVTAKCKEVVKALHESDQPAEVVEMLEGAVPHILVPSPRHRFQEQAIEMVAHILDDIKKKHEQGVVAAEASKQSVEVKITEQEGTIEQEQNKVTIAKEKATEKKRILADKARTFQAAKIALSDAQDQQNLGLADLLSAETHKEAVEACRSEIDGSFTGDAALKFVNRLQKHMQIEETLRTALPPVLGKEAKDRGGFDTMVVEQLKETVSKRLEELDTTITNAAPAKEAMQKALDAAQESLDNSKKAQMLAAHAYMEASSEVSALEDQLKTFKDTMLALRKERNAAVKILNNAQWDFDFFKDGPLAAFVYLRERTEEAEQMEDAAAPVAPIEALEAVQVAA